MKNTYWADAVGLICLAAPVLLAVFLWPGLQVSAPEWVFIYLMEVACAIFVWHHDKAPKQPRKWLFYALCSVLAALLWLVYSRLGAGLFFWGSEPKGSQAFDFAVALLISPGLTIIAIIGSVRALVSYHRD